MTQELLSVYAPVLTPFNPDLTVNSQHFLSHCRWVVEQGAGLAIFGTNSEAASLSISEKRRLLDEVVAAGIPASALMPGTGNNSLGETVELTRAAVDAGAPAVLVLPPFFFKPATTEGLIRHYGRLIEAVGSDKLQVVLYHIPQFTGVPVTVELVEGLRRRYPNVVGIKDSSGDRENLARYLDIGDGFKVFPASEILLGETMARGSVGCISATANVNAKGMVEAVVNTPKMGVTDAFAQAVTVRTLFQQFPMIQAMKSLIARELGYNDWRTVRAPLVELDAQAEQTFFAAVDQAGFSPWALEKAA
ncbi:dihydrodipicolinate synthase family protein [Aminobacter sp. MDW-2]|uniref:dihydrodipicolinate synthase family protein n=1 Tax=Aminobacter sp. MDW-2 TaxID=2666139 RepID=UPI0012AF7B0B|nr:dihydrodipicolinate synthase family protein [Aminobacter sp. MDW-2]MRX36750.1 dihydrodipicolinate synthase family protein [Aminobacter sp. MDW-2]QNH35483.1 dihydrodipicolinate synthase family protein [Aminobacter sp. MDW-2]